MNYSIFYGKIALHPISPATILLAAKMFTAKILDTDWETPAAFTDCSAVQGFKACLDCAKSVLFFLKAEKGDSGGGGEMGKDRCWFSEAPNLEAPHQHTHKL